MIIIALQVKTRDRQVLNNVPKVLPLLIDKIRQSASGGLVQVCALCLSPVMRQLH